MNKFIVFTLVLVCILAVQSAKNSDTRGSSSSRTSSSSVSKPKASVSDRIRTAVANKIAPKTKKPKETSVTSAPSSKLTKDGKNAFSVGSGKGSKSKTKTIKKALIAAAAGYIAVKAGKKILKAGKKSLKFKDTKYGFYKKGHKKHGSSSSSSSSSEEDSRECAYYITTQDTGFFDMWLTETERVTALYYECDADEQCCGMECCDAPKTIRLRYSAASDTKSFTILSVVSVILVALVA